MSEQSNDSKELVEIFEHYYDKDVDDSGKKKPNKSLGKFKIVDGQTPDEIFSDYSWDFVAEQDGKYYRVVGREVSYLHSQTDAGTKCHTTELPWLTKLIDMKPSDSATPKSDDKSPSTPTSTDTKIDPNIHDNVTIGISDYLTPYVKRINAAVAYAGDNDHEDVRSILKTLLTSEKNKAVLEARQEAVDYFSWRIDCSTLISELEGWRGCVEMAKDQTERHFALKSTNKNKE